MPAFSDRLRAVMVLAVVSLSACESTTPAAIGEAIEMGPYKFSVESAAKGKQWESAEGTYREIVVRIRVHSDTTKPFTDSFSSLFIDAIRIVDAAGNSIGTTPAPASPVQRAGRTRSEYYTCLFRFSRSSEGVRDFSRIGTTPADFRIVITNPAHESQQPRRVAVQLS